MSERKLGELLIANGLITDEQFAAALKSQKETPSIPIGQILCQLGFISAADLNLVLDFNKKRLKLGEILVKQRLIDQSKLDHALSISEKDKVSLGKALLNLHYIEEEQLAKAIAAQYDLPYVSLDKWVPLPELAHFVNVNYAMRHRIVAIERDGEVVTLAMAFPLSPHILHELEILTHCKIRPVIARESDIGYAQQRLYGRQRKLTIAGSDPVQLELVDDFSIEENKYKYVLDFNVEFLLKRLLSVGVKTGASDIHLENTERGLQIRYRIDGVLQVVGLGVDPQMIATHSRPLISKIKVLCELDITEKRRPQDGSFRVKIDKEGQARTVDFRVSIVPSKYGENSVIRILHKHGPMTLESIGFAAPVVEELERLLTKPTGIYLVTGPTGSGKTSTLYAILGKLNKPGVKTLTVEDPIEYSMDGICQSEVNADIGNTFAEYLRAFLRQDPDMIMVGEVRDQETAQISIRASLTGHTVLSTLHTNDSTGAVIRLIDMGIEPTLISATLRAVISQRLVRSVCTLCREVYTPANEILKEFRVPTHHNFRFVHGRGCTQCNFSGYSGRLPIVEIWAPSREDILLINKSPDNTALREASFIFGKRATMLEDGVIRVRQGETTLEELIRVVPYEQVEEYRRKLELRKSTGK